MSFLERISHLPVEATLRERDETICKLHAERDALSAQAVHIGSTPQVRLQRNVDQALPLAVQAVAVGEPLPACLT